MQSNNGRVVYRLLEEIFNATRSGSSETGGSEFMRGYIAGLASAAQFVIDADEQEGGVDDKQGSSDVQSPLGV